ncbi:isocitrate lyase/phosphoenolpyruvate mutase family protein [Hydrogenophaga sp. 5NK40-0174]
MPNAWDAGSARILAAEGFKAIGTTSAGIAYSLGLPDGANAVDRDCMLEAIHRISRSVDVPVNADLESGYGSTAREVGDTIRLTIEAGACGANIEDVDSSNGTTAMFTVDAAAERIEAARAAADSAGLPFTLTARCDAFLLGIPDALEESLARCQRYRAAGADCLFVPGINDITTIRHLVESLACPLNVVMGLTGNTLTVNDLAASGVRRISTGGSIARTCFGALRDAVREIQTRGSFGFANRQIPDAELSRFFLEYPSER